MKKMEKKEKIGKAPFRRENEEGKNGGNLKSSEKMWDNIRITDLKLFKTLYCK